MESQMRDEITMDDRWFKLNDSVKVNMPERQGLFADLRHRLSAGQGFTLATVNLDHVVKLRRLPAFRKAYSEHTHVVADGNPIVWISRLADRPVELIPGADLVHPLAALAVELDLPLALLGATETSLNRAAAGLVKAHPGLNIVAQISPAYGFDPEGEEAEACISALGQSGARLCILALGAPKQEVFAARAYAALPHCGFASLGAGLDFIAGEQNRAPAWVRQLALEWLWRMLSNPRRLARRYLNSALVLPGLALSAIRSR